MTYDLSRASDRALRHVDVSFRSDCPPEAFAATLLTGIPTPASRQAITLFLEEGDEEMLVDLVADGSSTFEILSRLSGTLLPADHPTTLFLKAPPL